MPRLFTRNRATRPTFGTIPIPGLISGALLALLCVAPAASAGDGTTRATPAAEALARLADHRSAAQGPAAGSRAAIGIRQGLDCFEQALSCGDTVFRNITTEDCAIPADPPFYTDIFVFEGTAGQTITATLTSAAFDPRLELQAPPPDRSVVVTSDDFAPGEDGSARIVHTLDESSPQWSLNASPQAPDVTGAYTLTLECSESEGFFTDPEFPDFRFRVVIEPPNTEPFPAIRLEDCQEDTVCLAGALPNRPELYIRILGPRPNGYLWPTLVRFTPSKVTVEIEQISTGDRQTYVLEGVGPGDDALSGLQDRTGFLP